MINAGEQRLELGFWIQRLEFKSILDSPKGRFVEIGRVKNSNGNEKDKRQISNEDDYGNKVRASFWETLRAYGGAPPENWANNGIVVHMSAGPPVAPGVNITCAGGDDWL
ncbi:hypothetical protein R6Q57_010186 [Mikania cordata]